MAQLGMFFNPAEYDPSMVGGKQQLSIGTHRVVIVGDEMIQLKDKTTQEIRQGFMMLSIDLQDVETNEKGYMRLNVMYPDPDKPIVERMAKNQLAALAAVTNTPGCSDTSLMFGKQFIVEVGKGNEGYANEVKEIKFLDGTKPTQAHVQALVSGGGVAQQNPTQMQQNMGQPAQFQNPNATGFAPTSQPAFPSNPGQGFPQQQQQAGFPAQQNQGFPAQQQMQQPQQQQGFPQQQNGMPQMQQAQQGQSTWGAAPAGNAPWFPGGQQQG